MSSKPDYREWHHLQPPLLMEAGRRFEYDEEQRAQLAKWLRLGEARRILEVGSGSGFFTGILRERSDADILCVEPDPVLRGYASGRFEGVRVIDGAAEAIPVEDGWADLTVCHIVLHNLPSADEPIREMARATRKGGFVAIIEPHGGSVHRIPDKTLEALSEKMTMAYAKAIWRERQSLIDYSKAPQRRDEAYLTAFTSAGLTSIEAHGLMSVFLLSDPRRSPESRGEWLSLSLEAQRAMREEQTRVLLGEGVPAAEIEEYYRRYEAYIRGLIEEPGRLTSTHELETVGRIVLVGRK